jgi:hypothetical protein
MLLSMTFDMIDTIVMVVMGQCQGQSLVIESSHAPSWNLVMEIAREESSK